MPADIRTIDIKLPVEQMEDESRLRKRAARRLRLRPEKIGGLRVAKRSIDARRAPIMAQLRVEVAIGGELPPEPDWEKSYPSVTASEKSAVIVGCGPAGLFAALRLIELGVKPIVLERGKDAIKRRFDLAPILREGRVVEDSNYCFGEGGAGAYSDGKLYTRATKRGPVRAVYETLVAHGAPSRILVDAHPHIGSNRLPNVVRALRETIIESGGEVRFESKATGLLRSSKSGHVEGVRLADGETLRADAVILATGHSARDVFKMLIEEGVRLEPKPFAMGVRIEHPQPLIDSIQYHYPLGKERPRCLPAASYRLASKIDGRGVHSFCMCPGGFIVPAATENDEVVVNGMSLSRRDSPFANSGFVVTIEPEDALDFRAEHGSLAGVAYQKSLEVLASRAGGGLQKAPAQRATDFLMGRLSGSLPKSSYHPGINSAPLHELCPAPIAARMAKGHRQFGDSMRGYLTEEAVLIGFETRTSSPVRVPRHEASLENPDAPRLFPCGEGAGYAGGIVSAALDGIRCGEAVARLVGARG